MKELVRIQNPCQNIHIMKIYFFSSNDVFGMVFVQIIFHAKFGFIRKNIYFFVRWKKWFFGMVFFWNIFDAKKRKMGKKFIFFWNGKNGHTDCIMAVFCRFNFGMVTEKKLHGFVSLWSKNGKMKKYIYIFCQLNFLGSVTGKHFSGKNLILIYGNYNKKNIFCFLGKK